MAQYTREQLARLKALSSDIMTATLLIDVTDRVGVMREFHSGTKFIEEAKQAHPQNALIQNMAAGIEESIQDIKSYTSAQRRAAQNTYRARIDGNLQLLGNDAEAGEFKAVLVDLAQKVAAAAGHGIFGSGEKISSAEAGYIQMLKQRLGVA
jgi:hypothetical protein